MSLHLPLVLRLPLLLKKLRIREETLSRWRQTLVNLQEALELATMSILKRELFETHKTYLNFFAEYDSRCIE